MNPCESQIFGCTLVPREEPLQNSNSTRLLLQGRGTVTPDAPDIDFLVSSPSVTWTVVREPGVRNRDYTGMWVRRGSSNLMAGKVVFLRGLLNPIRVVDLTVMNP
ncbi:hypothetical protein TNCV_4362671 [Trichonephila clavipes]|nr:hypothetical protein TNCV_4362671 [Trichonephila clavipes]